MRGPIERGIEKEEVPSGVCASSAKGVLNVALREEEKGEEEERRKGE